MVKNKKEIYKCNLCGNIVEVLNAGGGTLVCCGQEMILMKENVEDAAEEKHVPVIEKLKDSIKVTVGSVLHPMLEDHYIEWIEIIVDGKYCRKFLKPRDEPIAEFSLTGEKVKVREYCNLHGLWKAEN